MASRPLVVAVVGRVGVVVAQLVAGGPSWLSFGVVGVAGVASAGGPVGEAFPNVVDDPPLHAGWPSLPGVASAPPTAR